MEIVRFDIEIVKIVMDRNEEYRALNFISEGEMPLGKN